MVASPEPKNLNRPMTAGAIALSLLIYALWGGNNIAIKVAVEAIPPLAAAGFRFVLALIILISYARHRGVCLRLQPGEVRLLAWLVLAFVLQILTLNVGQKLTSAVRGTVFLAAHPLFIAFFAGLFIPGDSLRGRKLVGLLLAFAGILVTFSEGLLQSRAHLLGDAVIITSAVLLGGRLVLLKLIVQQIPVPRTLFWQAALGVPIFFALSLLFERGMWQPVQTQHVVAMGYQGLVIAGFCFLCNAWLLENFRASQVAAYVFTTPLWGVLLCGVLIHDPITPWVLAGTVLVACGIAVASRSNAAPVIAEAEAEAEA